MKVLIVGTGYVGTTTGLIFCEKGHQVTGLDLDERKIQALQAGKLHFYEPGLEDLLTKHLQQNHITFTNNTEAAIKEHDVIFICVGTPMSQDGSADLAYVKSVAKSIGRYANEYKVIVTKSTVPVGTAELVTNWVSESLMQPIDFDVVSNPEFLREGSALHDALYPDRIIIGTESQTARSIMRELYRDFACPVIETNPKASEMIKYAANSFLAMKISFINELARLCDGLEINVNDVSEGIGLDHRIGPHFLRAGMGYGGSCFPKDVNALILTAKEHSRPLSILEKVAKVNEEQPLYFIQKIKQVLGDDLEDKTVAILGLSFKANTDDIRESPSLVLIKQLLNEQVRIKAHDPVVKLSREVSSKLRPIKKLRPATASKFAFAPSRKYVGVPSYEAVTFSYQPARRVSFSQYDSIEEAVVGADAVILCTDWEEYKNLNWGTIPPLMNQAFIFDGRNMLDRGKMETLGFDYFGIANF